MKTATPLSLAAAAALLLPTAASAQPPGPAPATNNPAQAGDGVPIGVSRQDGVTVSADGAVVTRNGATEKLTKDLNLPSGVTVRPDGTVIMADKSEVPLRSTQILTFEGKIVPLPVDPRVNPGDPRSNGTGSTPTGGVIPGGATPGGNAAVATGTSRSLPRSTPAASRSVFLGSDGVPFMGTLNPDGTLLRADGTVLRADGSFRAVTFAPDGTPTLGTVNSNGTITRADGATVAPDGSVVGANGRVLSPATQNNPLGTMNNGNANPGVPQQNAAQANNGFATGRNANSPNNAGTLNQGNAAGGQSANNTGTVNNPALNPQAAPGNRPGTGGTNQPGARSGTATGTNSASGATSTGGSGSTGRAGGTSGATGGASSGGGASGAGGSPR